MYCFHDFLQEIYLNTNIPFIIKLDDKEVFSSIDNEVLIENKIAVNLLELDCRRISIITLKKDENCISLLSYLIKNKLKEILKNNEDLVRKLLNGEIIEKDLQKNELSILKKDFYIINLHLENNKIFAAKELIDALYCNKDIISIIFDENIVVLGNFEDILDHMKSLKESIESNIYSECYISYKRIQSINNIKSAFEINKHKINLAIKYNLEENIYDEKDLFFEWIIDQVDSEFKNKISKDIEDNFSKMDDELIRTINVLYKCGLNLSEAAKSLYIHRNTLIYRIEKIQKYTNYDIRNFKEAVDFKIIFSIWREKRKYF